MKQLLAALAAVFGGAQLARMYVSGKYRALYKAMGERYGVDPNVLHAIALQETRENPSLVSLPNRNGTRDYGLMQINDTNFTRYGLTDTSALDPGRSVDTAARLIRDIMVAIPGASVLDIFSVYNAGISAHDADPITPGKQLRPKYASDNIAYFNQEYVRSAMLWYLLVLLGSAAPVPSGNWTR